MRRCASASSRISIERAAASYVSTLGGGRRAARRSSAGISATAKLGQFLGGVAAHGVEQTLRDFNLGGLAGRSAQEVIAAVFEALAPSGASLEDAAARQAVDDVIELFDQYIKEGRDLTPLEAMDLAAVRDALCLSVQLYIFERWLQELGRSYESGALSASDAVKLERDVKAYIQERVILDFEGIDLATHWGSSEVLQQIEAIYETAYSMLEASE